MEKILLVKSKVNSKQMVFELDLEGRVRFQQSEASAEGQPGEGTTGAKV